MHTNNVTGNQCVKEKKNAMLRILTNLLLEKKKQRESESEHVDTEELGGINEE